MVSVDVKQHSTNKPPRPLSPSVPAVAGRQLVRAAAYNASNSGESLHCFLVGVIMLFVIAIAEFIHVSNLLPSLPTPLPYKVWRWRARLEVEESHTDRETV